MKVVWGMAALEVAVAVWVQEAVGWASVELVAAGWVVEGAEDWVAAVVWVSVRVAGVREGGVMAVEAISWEEVGGVWVQRVTAAVEWVGGA